MHITDAELKIVQVLWSQGPLSSGDIVEQLAGTVDWSPKTVRSLLDRLTTRGVLQRSREGRSYRYQALLAQEDWLAQQADEFVEQHYQGRLAPLVSAFARRERLSEADRQEILAMLEDPK